MGRIKKRSQRNPPKHHPWSLTPSIPSVPARTCGPGLGDSQQHGETSNTRTITKGSLASADLGADLVSSFDELPRGFDQILVHHRLALARPPAVLAPRLVPLDRAADGIFAVCEVLNRLGLCDQLQGSQHNRQLGALVRL